MRCIIVFLIIILVIVVIKIINLSKFVNFFFKKSSSSKKQTNILNLFSSLNKAKNFKINYDIRHQHTSSTHTNNKSAKESSEFNKSNSLTLGKSKYLMRLIYSRVHPDLFTNHEQAQVFVYYVIIS